MRNLKRVLSLALATVMLLGMMVIGAGAADAKKTAITDLDKAVNKDAVNLMVDLGIIVGKPDGTFAPTETVDRATMAKLIYFILMGTTDESSFKGVSTPLTDVKGNWAEGFINYCFSMKIVAGVGDNKFNPSGKVTTASAAKMLLVALGYDSAASKYEGDAMWSVNIMRDAQKAGLLKGIDQKSGDELTRDSAAQMIFNALFAETVLPDFQYDMGVKYLKKYDGQGTTLGVANYKLLAVSSKVTGISAGKATLLGFSVGKTTGLSVAGTALTNALTATPECIGSNVTIYVKGYIAGTTLNVDKIYSSALTVNKSNVLATNYGYKSTGDTALAALLVTAKTKVASLEDTKVLDDLKYYYNGVDATGVTGVGAGINTEVEVRAQVGKNGVITEFKDTDSAAGVDTVVVTEKAVKTLTADATTKVDGADTKALVPGVINSYTNVKTVVGYEGLKKNDVVLVVVIGGITYIEKAAIVEGKAASKDSTNAITVDGTKYAMSALAGTSYDSAAFGDYANTYKFFVDNNKSIVKATKTSDKTSDAYAVVLESAWVNGSGAIGESKYAQVKVLKSDATTEVVTASKLGGKTIVAPADSLSDSTTIAFSNVAGTSKAITNGNFYSYSVDSKGKYELTAVSSVDLDTATITSNKADFDASGSNIANDKTVFLYKTGSVKAPTYTAYVGIANVPGVTLTNKNLGKVVNKDNIATYVYVNATGTSLSGQAGEYVYVPANSAGGISYDNVPNAEGTGVAYKSVKAIVNGEVATIKVGTSVTLGIKTGSEQLVPGGLYKVVTKDNDGIITDFGTKLVPETGINISGGTVVSSTFVGTVNEDTKIFYINTDGEVSVLAIDGVTKDASDKIVVVDANNDKRAEAIYIMQVVNTGANVHFEGKLNGNAITGTATGNITSNTTAPCTGLTGASLAGQTLTLVVTPKDPDTDLGVTYTVSPATKVLVAGTTSYEFVVTTLSEDGNATWTNTVTMTFTSVTAP